MQQDWAATETWLERIVESDSSNLDAYHALAGLYRRQGAVGRAIRMHQNLLLRTDLAKEARNDALLELASDFKAGGFTERAVASFEEYLSQKPRDVAAMESVIPLLVEQREFSRASTLAKKLKRADAGKSTALQVEIALAEAVCLAEEGHAEGAMKAVKRALRQDKQCAPALRLLGEFEAERGKSAKALDAWKKAALASEEAGQTLYEKIGAGYAASKKPENFNAFLKEILEERPTDTSARIALARSLASRGATAVAIEELARAVEVQPSDLALRAEHGRQLLAASQEAEALKAYAELLAIVERSTAERVNAAAGSDALQSAEGTVVDPAEEEFQLG